MSQAIVLLGAIGYLLLLASPCRTRVMAGTGPAGICRGPRVKHASGCGLQMIELHNEFGPEHIAIGPDGKLYAAMTSGSIVRMDPDGGRQETFVSTGGRVLGFDFDATGQMIAADAVGDCS